MFFFLLSSPNNFVAKNVCFAFYLDAFEHFSKILFESRALPLRQKLYLRALKHEALEFMFDGICTAVMSKSKLSTSHGKVKDDLV